MLFLILILLGAAAFCQSTLHDFTVKTLEGEDFELSQLRGKKVLIVNTASKCALSPQYGDLQRLYEKYGEDGFVVVGFPANNYANREPGTNEEIREFCTTKYGVTFPMMAKISVKGGDIHPLYQWLTQKELNGFEDSSVSWNFQKYLIDAEGKLVGSLPPRTKPNNDKIISWIEGVRDAP